MNLYICWCKEAEYATFVFAVNANQAKRMTCEWENDALGHYDVTYQDIEYEFIGKTDKVATPTLVDTDRNPLYSIVEELGGKYEEIDL